MPVQWVGGKVGEEGAATHAVPVATSTPLFYKILDLSMVYITAEFKTGTFMTVGLEYCKLLWAVLSCSEYKWYREWFLLQMTMYHREHFTTP